MTSRRSLECREALAFPGDAADGRAAPPGRGAPRRAQRPGRARLPAGSARRDDGGAGRAGHWVGRTGELHLRWSGAPADALAEDGAARLDAGRRPRRQHHDLVLEVSRRRSPRPPVAEEAWTDGGGLARSAPPRCESSLPRGLRHSWAVLRGLTEPRGAMVAAATTSLPERAERGSHYDYRYAWIRDQCYAGQAAAAAGADDLLDAASASSPRGCSRTARTCSPAYTVDGGRVPDERALDLPGLPGRHR